MHDQIQPRGSAVSGQNQESLLTVSATAHRLSISESFLRHLIQKKAIPGVVRIGRAVRFDPAVIEAHIGELKNAAQRN